MATSFAPLPRAAVILLIATGPALASDAGRVKPVAVEIGILPGLQFDPPRFRVEPGTEVKLTFKNNGEMAHNLIITQPAQRMAVVQAALALGADGPERQYLPESPKILQATRLLNPGDKQEISFTAPKRPGIYPYVCTFPGHGFVMYGAMYVGREPPPVARDTNLPEVARAGAIMGKSWHAFGHKRPLMYRIFMPDAGPAAIAVAMNHQESYCWDAGDCRLRYAWSGGFIDPWPVWKGKGNALATIKGEVFWRETAEHPLRVESPERTTQPRFRGYRKADGHPEFTYELDGAEVRELITPLSDGTGLSRRFRIRAVDRPVFFLARPHGGVTYTTSAGTIRDGVIQLSPKQAGDWTLTLRRQEASP